MHCCLLFGSAAWKTAPRDLFIGWSDGTRKQKVNLITADTRFLILSQVKVPHLASHFLGTILRRLSSDWQRKYGHPIHLVETFVEKDRFRGTCYRGKMHGARHAGIFRKIAGKRRIHAEIIAFTSLLYNTKYYIIQSSI